MVFVCEAFFELRYASKYSFFFFVNKSFLHPRGVHRFDWRGVKVSVRRVSYL